MPFGVSESRMLEYMDLPGGYYFDAMDFEVRKVFWMNRWIAMWLAKRHLRKIIKEHGG